MSDRPPPVQKATRCLLLGAVQGLAVTHVDLEGDDGLWLDEELLEAAGLTAFEKVEVVSADTGTRLSTSVRPGPAGSGVLRLEGAAAVLMKPGERVTVSAFGWVKTKAAAKHQPRIVRVDEDNRVIPAKRPKAP